MRVYHDFIKDKPATTRYNTPPAHLVGKVQLEYDKSAMMCIGREEKEAGDAMQEEAISTVADSRDEGHAVMMQRKDQKAKIISNLRASQSALGVQRCDSYCDSCQQYGCVSGELRGY